MKSDGLSDEEWLDAMQEIEDGILVIRSGGLDTIVPEKLPAIADQIARDIKYLYAISDSPICEDDHIVEEITILENCIASVFKRIEETLHEK